MANKWFLVFFCVAVLCIRSLDGADFFESVNARLMCYDEKQEDCFINKDLTDAYPEYSWSYDNLTKATTHMYLFTKDNVDEPEKLHKCAADVPQNSKFNPQCRTEIFLPGFVSGICNFAIYRELKNERLKCGCYNVILIDWMWGNIFDLVEAKNNMRIVANHTVILIRNLKKRFNLTADHFILTGHSYGAHMAGYIGHVEPIGIINGIDPSGVLFSEKTPLDERLDAGDAKCVHVTHCNAGQCLPFFAVNFTCGTVDFWFNGGLFQPACNKQTFISFIKQDWIYAGFSLFPPACQHFQCLQYYKASMCPEDNECQFIGVKCGEDKHLEHLKCRSCGRNGENCAVTGAYACDCLSKNTTGDYCLNTSLDCPFCDNKGIKTCGYSCPAAKGT